MSHLGTILSRLKRDQRGFTLVEVLVASLMLVLILMAITNVGDAGRTVATRDGELALAVSESQPGLDRMVRELRQAVAINPTGAAPGQCASRANCVDFNMMDRTPTDAAGKPIPGALRSLYRVRYACVPPTGSVTATCRRYVSSDIAVPAIAPGSAVVERALNGTPTSATPIFRYRTKDGAELTAADALTAARTIDVSIQVPAKGERMNGFAHSVVLHDGAQLKNIDVESGP